MSQLPLPTLFYGTLNLLETPRTPMPTPISHMLLKFHFVLPYSEHSFVIHSKLRWQEYFSEPIY